MDKTNEKMKRDRKREKKNINGTYNIQKSQRKKEYKDLTTFRVILPLKFFKQG